MNSLHERCPCGRIGTALLLLRFIVGLAFLFHGWPKVTNVAGFAGQLHLPLWLAGVAAYTELIGGVLLILGGLTALATLFLLVQMVVALFMVHFRAGHPFVNPQGPSFELPALYLFLMLAFLFAGPGAYSLDASLMRQATSGETAARSVGRRRGVA
jgi:putative oxidoreductase